tara:strand:- start:26 stop:685 length:660 start_codon:yes stop_codon:yes gene_type:complete
MTFKIYALKNSSFDKPYIKIGHTTDVDKRIKSLNTATPEPSKLVFSLDTGSLDKRLAVALEKYLHTTFNDHRCKSDREFFLVDAKYVLVELILKLQDFHEANYTTAKFIDVLNVESSFNLNYNEIWDMSDSVEKTGIFEHPDASSHLEAKYMWAFHRPIPLNSKNRRVVTDKREICWGEFILKKCTGHSSLGDKTPPLRLRYSKRNFACNPFHISSSSN